MATEVIASAVETAAPKQKQFSIKYVENGAAGREVVAGATLDDARKTFLAAHPQATIEAVGEKRTRTRKGAKRTRKSGKRPVFAVPEGGFTGVVDINPQEYGLPSARSFADPALFHESASKYYARLVKHHDTKREQLVALGDANVRKAAATADSKLDEATAAIQALLAANPALAAAMSERLAGVQAALLQVNG